MFNIIREIGITEMKRTSKHGKAADEMTKAELSLPQPTKFDILGIPESEFSKMRQAAEQGSLTEPELDWLVDDLRRATTKRKLASANSVQAASASAREQAIVGIQLSYARSGVRSRRGQKKGGQGYVQYVRDNHLNREADVHLLADQLLSSGTAKRDVSGVIANRTGLSITRVLYYLHTHKSRLWGKKLKPA